MGMTRIRNRGEGMQLEIRGATVDVTVSGDSGRGVLLLHGFMCSAQMMSSVQEALCGQMRVAAIDFPGHGKNGKSAPPPKPWGVPDYMEMTRRGDPPAEARAMRHRGPFLRRAGGDSAGGDIP